MKALVSGRSGRALILDGESWQSFDLDDPTKMMVRHPSELPYLFGEAKDLSILTATNVASVAHELEREHNFTCALDLTLISLDPELAHDIRQEALQEVEEMFADGTVLERVENVMYAAPLPEDADLKKAQELCDASLKAVQEFLQRLEDHQSAIANAVEAWETIPVDKFPSFENKKHFRHVAVKEGLFRALATLDSPASVSTFLLKANLNRSVQQLPNYRQVLQEWTKPFRQSRETRNIVVEDDEETISEERFGKRGRIDRRAVLREAVKRKSAIVTAMHSRDLARVEYLVDELVAYHQCNSESQHTAKSLCDLAMEAKVLGMYSLQLALTERAISVAPGDNWSWAQHGDALLNVGRLDDALKAYGQANAFGVGVIAKKGRAEVLKAQGKFVDALAAFDEVIQLHPDDVFARTGRAEVLKAQGKFVDALAAFDEVIRLHPDNVVAKNGRAEVLKAQGKFVDALAAFDEVIQLHPDDVVAKNGRAEVLKAQGKFVDALAAFDEVIQLHPYEAVTRNGRSCVLVALGRYDEALDSLPITAPVDEQDWIGYHIRGICLLRLGDTVEAIRIFNKGLQDCPFSPHKEYFRGALGLSWLRGRNFKEAADTLDAVTSPLLQPSANVIRIHVFGAQGDRQRAFQAYESLAIAPHLQQDPLTMELHHQYILSEKPTKDDEWIFDGEVQIFLRVA
jgi:tetratricopeptide (TPR) repeat protein